MSQTELKEAFVSNLNGTSLLEVAVGSFLSPLCFLTRGLLLILCHRGLGTLPLPAPQISHLLFDYTALVLPLVLSCTILSNILYEVVISLCFVSVCVLLYISRTNTDITGLKLKSFFDNHLDFEHVPFVTTFRVFVNVKTAISILAVDFKVFPRRFAKTEIYGTGVMDFGVGGFVFANALVCPEARRKNIGRSKSYYIVKQLVSVWPLVILGLGRLIGVKMTGYHEHVTEYGVHWNFFFTLAIVRVAASIILTVLPVSLSSIFALLITVMYQVTLETTSLKSFMIHNNNRELDFLHANKEGIFSIVGYVAIYLAGVNVGRYVMQHRSNVNEWLKTLFYLLFVTFCLYVAVCTCQVLLEPVSRRLANLPFCLWSVSQSLFMMSCVGLVDLLLVFSKTTAGVPFLPSSWSLRKKQPDSSSAKKQWDLNRLCLVQAVNRNQLIFFLLANLMTGLTNSLVDTLNCNSEYSVYVLLLYMFVNSFVIYILHHYGVTVKFW